MRHLPVEDPSEVQSMRLAGAVLYGALTLSLLLVPPRFLVALSALPYGGFLATFFGFFFSASWLIMLAGQAAAIVGHSFAASAGCPIPQPRALPYKFMHKWPQHAKLMTLVLLELLSPASPGRRRAGDILTLVLLSAAGGAALTAPSAAASPSLAALGAAVGAVHSIRFVAPRADLLQFPHVARPRVLTIKRGIPSALYEAIEDVRASSLLALPALTYALGPRALLSAVLLRPLATLHQAADCLLLAFTVAVGLQAAALVVASVYSERLNLSYPPLAPPTRQGAGAAPAAQLAPAAAIPAVGILKDPKADPLLQAHALWDLCLSSEDAGEGGWRRRVVFDVPSGEAWTAVASLLHAELEELVKAVVRAAPSTAPIAPLVVGAAPVVALDREVAEGLALWQAECRHLQLCWSARALASLAVASRREDRYGHLKLREPTLGAVVRTLVQCRRALMRLREMREGAARAALDPMRNPRSIPSTLYKLYSGLIPSSIRDLWAPRDAVHPIDACLDVIRSCLYRIEAAFGEEIGEALARGPGTGPSGPGAKGGGLVCTADQMKKDVEALLKRVL